jgi:Xaa-Pro aminopeptidase
VNRLADCLAELRVDGIDALVLGRDCHVRALTGETRLWLSGTRPFTPAGIVVAATGTMFVPPLTWNPAHVVEQLRGVPGFTDARRIGVDGMTPMADGLLRQVVPDATFVDATPLMRRVVRVKTPEEIDALRAAAAVAVDAFAALRHPAEPHADAIARRAAFAVTAGVHGVTTPSYEAIVAPWGTSTWFATHEHLRGADHLVLRAGVLRDGWEACLARTDGDARSMRPAGWDDTIDACRPGARVEELPIAHGVGRGIEPLPADLDLEPGMVVAVELADELALRQDVVLVTEGAPEVLTAGAP